MLLGTALYIAAYLAALLESTHFPHGHYDKEKKKIKTLPNNPQWGRPPLAENHWTEDLMSSTEYPTSLVPAQW